MTPTQNRILVKFDETPETPLNLIIPERFVVHEQGGADDNETRQAVTTDRRLINPQTVTVLSGQYEGCKAFVYYGAYEVSKFHEGVAIMPETHLIFLTDPMKMLPEIYLGEEIFSEGEKTASGIYTTPVAEYKEAVKIRLTHVPEKAVAEVGEVVITVDGNQYWLLYGGKRYIKLRESEIAGVETENGIVPVGERILVEYLPDPEADARMAENEKRYNQMDFLRKHNMHVYGVDFKPVPEPKTIEAKVIASGCHECSPGDTVLIFRKYGVKIGEQWLIGKDSLLATIKETA